MPRILQEMKDSLQRQINKHGPDAGKHYLDRLEELDIYGYGTEALLHRALEKIDELEDRITALEFPKRKLK